MTTEIIVYIDYVCPYCLLVEKELRQVIKGKDIKIRWQPFELRPFPVPTLKVEDGYLPSIWNHSVYPMADKLGIYIELPKISPQPRTGKAFEAFAFAENHGLGDEFSMAVMAGFFQQGKNIGDVRVLTELGEGIGLNRIDMERSLESNAYREQHQKALKNAINEANITVVPTIIIGEYCYQGFPTKNWLNNALEALAN
jgi:predicted DsbA family dithiol-disulfide isomerase